MNIKKKQQKKKKQGIKEVKQKIKSTLDLIQIDEVKEYHVELKKDKKEEVMVGIKLEPHSLFLDSKQEQSHRIHLLRSALNRMNFDVWHGFVFNPINLDVHLISLVRQMSNETDPIVQEMLQDDIDKAQMFTQTYRELEFFMMIKGAAGKKLEDKYRQLQSAIANAGFKIKPLTHLDFDNYIAYEFENDLINDYYFSRGVFDEDILEEAVEAVDEEDDDDEY